mmetsp:Transcript_27904/g.44730  ORF Transcript_27904/g.44730 Transcript_27904/m.44730 type:complete len:1362 (-) Transcript_27904:126-4211(-)|eukprot:CAMPEP_0203757892 /NCGR_PEP_ID=MMETSP0098-20131031/10743_1 /ASSEMBLY_ACC=CAM_ASM_000208 /TAXON_ID=96639 /ORGANISM=" , Strain NY0313808BC1" /LENGTH=1361 /DNA_ID=CAMNT_0050650137 /DNA_START=369 /DNA_END=4454 /DNA_ORIENTATION=+
MITGIRSNRSNKRDQAAEFTEAEWDDMLEVGTEPVQREESLIEIILGRRVSTEEGADEKTGYDRYQYLVKWREKSYLHCEWVSADLIQQDVNGVSKLKRFTAAQPPDNIATSKIVEFFDPLFVEVERILDASHGQRLSHLDPWMREANQLLSKVINYREKGMKLSVYFMLPVDEEKDFAPGYYSVIEKPMDLGTIRSKLLGGNYYTSMEQIADDIRLVFANCRKYNANAESHVRECGDALAQYFECKYTEQQRGDGFKEEEETRRYLVKWKGLSYADATWESEADILDDQAIAAYFRRAAIPASKRRANKEMDGEPQFYKYTQSPSFKDGLQLRSYQLEGLNWLAFNHAYRRGSILADEMGLGKTCQTVSFVNHLRTRCNINLPCLVVAPLSTLGHWRNEFERWTDLNCVLYHDAQQNTKRMPGAQTRGLIREFEFYYWRKNQKTGVSTAVPGIYKFDVLVTSYEVLVADAAEFSNIRFAAVIVDEGHRLKSTRSKIVQTFREYIRADMRVILTGTPLQNNVGELWALLNFIEPKEFPDERSFLEMFGDLQNAEQVMALQNRVKPFMLRRLKEHVEKDIPAKEETVIDVELTTLQKKYYRAIFERNREFLGGSSFSSSGSGSSSKVGPQLVNIEMELRKCCNHPFLIKGVEERELANITAPYGTEDHLKHLIQSSGKMVLLDKLLAKLKAEKRKVLIFSQFKMMLDIIGEYCGHPARKYGLERIDGNVSGNERQKAIDRFCDPNAQSFVFLLSTRAGGVGINLTAADTVIIFDSDWNPQNDLQAMARCHRIGQKKSVMVYRFVTRQTYEAHLFDRAARKLGLEQAVLGRENVSGSVLTSGKKAADVAEPTSKEEIEELLRYGAYRLLEDDDETAEKQKQYSESNIDDLLLRDSRKVDWAKGDKDGAAGGGMNFSKASFVAAGTDKEIDVSDPKFWTKVLGEDPRSTMVARLVDGSAYETEEKKKKFFDELRTVGYQVIAEKLEGNARPAFERCVADCLLQISNMKRTFNDREREAAEQFLKQVERPSRRKKNKKKVKKFYDEEELPEKDETSEKEQQQGTENVIEEGDDGEAAIDSGDEYSCSDLEEGPRKPLVISGKTISRKKLQALVKEYGGYEDVVANRLWQEIRKRMGLKETSSSGHQVHKAYQKYFLAGKTNMAEEIRQKMLEERKSKKNEMKEKKAQDRKRKKSGKKKKRKRKKNKVEVVIEMLDPEIYVKLTKEKKPWCRYCGATETSGWSRGPWGAKMLCISHYVMWHQKNTLNLDRWEKHEPEQPINPEVNTQFRYLAWKKEKEEMEAEDSSEEEHESADPEPGTKTKAEKETKEPKKAKKEKKLKKKVSDPNPYFRKWTTSRSSTRSARLG